MVPNKCRERTNMSENPRLRSITKSNSCIQELKRKLENIDQAVTFEASHNLIDCNSKPMLKVEEKDKGFLIRVLSGRSCHGLLTFILEAFEELGLHVVSARVNCVDGFCLEAVGAKDDNEEADHMDAQVVQRSISQAIQNWRQLTINDNLASS